MPMPPMSGPPPGMPPMNMPPGVPPPNFPARGVPPASNFPPPIGFPPRLPGMPPMPPNFMPPGMPPNFPGIPSFPQNIPDPVDEEVMDKNKSISRYFDFVSTFARLDNFSSAIKKAVDDASHGDYGSAIECLLNAISQIKQSKVVYI